MIPSVTVENANNPSNKKTISGKVFIDCSYVGDLMARSGVSYTVGRESNEVYNETVNGVYLSKNHQFPDGISPYKNPGNLSGGVVYGVDSTTMAPEGTGDKKVQAYNYNLYLYCPRDPWWDEDWKYTSTLKIKIKYAGNTKTVIKNAQEFASDWIPLGQYEMDRESRIEIIANDSKKIITADTVLMVP